MRRTVTAVVVAAVVVLAAPGLDAGERRAKRVPAHVLDAIVDDEPNPLPRGLAPHEIGLPIPAPDPFAERTPPAGAVATPSEYARNAGLIVSWGSFNDLLTAMVVGITTGDPDARAYVAVASSSQQSSAAATLSAAGAVMDRVEFVLYDTNTVWMRDYGPRFIVEDGRRAMVDHVYNRPRPADDAFPGHLASLWGEPLYDMPLIHGGGNFHLFSDGTGYMTELVLDENPSLDEADVAALYDDYQGLAVDVVDALPSSYDSTQHIDMWMLPVGPKEVIVGQYAAADADAYAVTEGAVQHFQSLGYTVHRTPGWRSGGWYGAHYTYTNAVVFNEMVFTCSFSGYPTQNQAAQAVFEAAFPDHDIVPLDCSSVIQSAGALHCIVMHVPEAALLFEDGFEDGGMTAWSDVTGD